MRLDRLLHQKAHSARRLLVRAVHTWQREGFRAAAKGFRSSLRGVLRPAVRKYVPSDFDLEHGVDTAGIVRISEMEITSPNYVHGIFYKASHPDGFHGILHRLDLPWQRFHFIDVGSGKGLVLMLAADYPFHRITGVEFGANLHRIAQKNITAFSRSRKITVPIESICADAATYRYPSDPLVLYFYDPFELPVLRRVIETLRSSYRAHKREIIVIYHNAPRTSVLSEMLNRRMELFAQSGMFQLVAPASDEDYSIYATEEVSLPAERSLSKSNAS